MTSDHAFRPMWGAEIWVLKHRATRGDNYDIDNYDNHNINVLANSEEKKML